MKPQFCLDFDKLFLKRIKGVPKEMPASQKFKWNQSKKTRKALKF